MIQLAKKLTFPDEIVTQTIGILAKRRAGKSYTARRFTEQLSENGHQVVIVDPKGDWWGIRSSATGKSSGLPITILGGERGDVPLERAGGELVAKLVVEERVSVLLDLSFFRKADISKFMADFLETLYRLKAREKFRTPVMLVIDEADAIAPQKPNEKGDQLRMLGAAEDIVRRGGQRGIGCTMITQRSAVLNKNVLTQIEVLIALRTISPQDLKAIDAWIDVHGSDEERKTLKASLPSLPVGDAWVWSPGWPTKDGIFQRVHVSPIKTFDSGATPKPGEKRVEPKAVADVDLERVRKQMADVVQRAAASDPKALQARIRELEREIKAAKKAAPETITDEDLEAIQKEARELAQASADEAIAEIQTEARELAKGVREASDSLALLSDQAERIIHREIRVSAAAPSLARSVPSPRRPAPTRLQVSPAPGSERSQNSARSDSELNGPMQKILDELATLSSFGIEEPPKAQVALLCGYSNAKSGGFAGPLSRLRELGLVSYGKNGPMLTDDGFEHAAPREELTTHEDLHHAVISKLDPPVGELLRLLIDAYPERLQKVALAEARGYSNAKSGGFAGPMGQLRSLGLIDYPAPGEAVAMPVLFP